MDPFELRLKKAMRPGTSTATCHRLGDSVALVETIERVRREVQVSRNAACDGHETIRLGDSVEIF